MNTQAVVNQYIERFAGEPDEVMRGAHERAGEAGVQTPQIATGQFLRWLAGLGPTHGAVEIGAAGGTTGLWLLAGMAPKATLTSIEPNPAAADLARRAYTAADRSDQVRAIHGNPGQVLARLADASYELALLNAEPTGWPEYLPHLSRILRPGGLLIAVEAMCGGAVGDPAVTDPAVSAARMFNATLRDDEQWNVVMLQTEDGLLLAQRGREG